MNNLTKNEKELLKAKKNLSKVSSKYILQNHPEIINAQELVKFWEDKVNHDRLIETKLASSTKIDNSRKEVNNSMYINSNNETKKTNNVGNHFGNKKK